MTSKDKDGFTMPPPRIVTASNIPPRSSSSSSASDLMPPPPPVLPSASFQKPSTPQALANNNNQPKTEASLLPPAPVPPSPPVIQLDYLPPDWAAPIPSPAADPTNGFYFEVIKNGTVVETISLSSALLKPQTSSSSPTATFLVMGRFPDACNILQEHPSISRTHCVLQFGNDGMFHVYDLNSTYGTFVNRRRIAPKVHVPFPVGCQLSLGDSTRSLLLNGPVSDVQEEEEKVEAERQARAIEAKARAAEEKLRLKLLKAGLVLKISDKQQDGGDSRQSENEGISWGMMDDDDGSEAEIQQQQQAQDQGRESLMESIIASKKRKDMTYEEGVAASTKNAMQNSKRIKFQGAADAGGDDDGNVEVDDEGEWERIRRRQKELVEAAGIGDDEEDENDDFYDRTKAKTKKKGGSSAAAAISSAKKPTGPVETFETLTAKKTILQREMDELRQKLSAAKTGRNSSSAAQGENVDALDAFMGSVSTEFGAKEMFAMEQKLQDLAKDLTRLDKLIKIVRPVEGLLAFSAASSAITPAPVPSIPVVAVPTAPVAEIEQQPQQPSSRFVKAEYFLSQKKGEKPATAMKPAVKAPAVVARKAEPSVDDQKPEVEEEDIQWKKRK